MIKQPQLEVKKSGLKLNLVVLLLGQVYGQALAGVSGIVLVRWLGPHEYGNYTLAVAGLNLGAVVADAGLSAYIGREAARVDTEVGLRLWRTALWARLGLSLLVGLLTLGLTLVWTAFGQPTLIILADLSLIPMSVIILTTAFLNGLRRTPLSTGLNALIGTLNFGLLLIGLVWQPLAATALGVNLLSSLVGAWLLARPVLKLGQSELEIQAPSMLALLKASRSFWLIGLASVVFQYADVYLVSIFLNEEAVGQYGAALRLLTIMTTLPTVWGVVAVPRFARQPLQTRPELRRWHFGLLASGVGLALVGMFLTEPLVSLLLGQKYGVAGHILSWLVWAGAGIFASAAPVTWLTVTNRQHLILVALVGADLLGLVLTTLFGGVFGWGLEGIALARICTSSTLCGLYVLLALAFNTTPTNLYN